MVRASSRSAESMGNRPGGGVNLFHSFTTFDVAAGDKALFSADPAFLTRNIISRVTGGSPSTIEGTLASNVTGAALYFLNPSGVVFGPHAHVEVPGAVHVATAATLTMLPDDPTGALTFTGAARLAMAQPTRFGFLGQPVVLAIEGSALNAATGQRAFAGRAGCADRRGFSTRRLMRRRVSAGAWRRDPDRGGGRCEQRADRPAQLRARKHRARRHCTQRTRRRARQSCRHAGDSRWRRSTGRGTFARRPRRDRCRRAGNRTWPPAERCASTALSWM
jgi:filamentous hemagglutinin family protein